jgi:hypothetical protein
MSSHEFGVTVRPSGGFVVAGVGLQASVQDADEPVGQPPEGVVVFDSAGAGRRSRRGRRARRSGRRRPGPERASEPVVVDEPGGDEPGRSKGKRRNAPKLRGGMMKRGKQLVIRHPRQGPREKGQ